MNRRFALIAAVCLFAARTPSMSHAQAKPAAQAAAGGARRARPSGSRR